jgi:hypothetical protein
MGATGWHYTTQYDPDPEHALQRLREETFEAGDYLPPGGIMRLPFGLTLDLPLRVRLFLTVFRLISAISIAAHWLARGGRQPRSIDELLAMTGENGTHSILDITHTADIPELCAATPLSKQRLLKSFGTLTPTRAQADAIIHGGQPEIDESYRRWEAVYLVVYDDDGSPMDYLFIGASGD